MSRSQMWSASILGWVLAVGLSGCGGSTDNLPREAVSGSVTLGGQPLAKGTIVFAPTSDKLPTDAKTGISDGKYSIPRAEGLVPGTYKVAISSLNELAETKSPHGLPGKVSPPAKNLVPRQYNIASALTKEVKGGETNTFDCELSNVETKDVAPKGNTRSQRDRQGSGR